MSDVHELVTGRNFKVEMESQGGSVILRIVGTISEDTDFGQALPALDELAYNANKVRIDLSQVTEINSCGVREWLIFMEKLQSKREIRFINLSEVIVFEANNVINMLGNKGTPVDKFHSPYFCEACDKRYHVAVSPGRIIKPDGTFEAPPMRCPKCSSALEFDEYPDEYFAFLTYHMPTTE